MVHPPRNDTIQNARSLVRFFVLLFALAVPFWLVGAMVSVEALPGLPVADTLIVLCPLIAACIVTRRERGPGGVKQLLKRALDSERIQPKWWYAPILLIMPATTVASYGLMRLLGLPLPPAHIPILATPVLFLAFCVGAACEEVGWTGCATAAMRSRWSVLQTGVVLGTVGAAWHIVQLLQIGRSITWIGWWALWTVAARVVVVWLYDNAGQSVFAAVLFHATMNLSWQLFPNAGSHWDPRFNGLILALAAVFVTVGRHNAPASSSGAVA